MHFRQIQRCTLLQSGPTGVDLTDVILSALNIGTIIVNGLIELVSEYKIVHAGENLTPSAAVLLSFRAIVLTLFSP